jgi:hypothetical protein
MGRVKFEFRCIWLLFLGAILSGTQFRLESRGQNRMPNDPFFNRVTLQLIQTPASSIAALAASAKGLAKPASPQPEFPIQSAKSWIKLLLKDAYQPSSDAAFIAFPMEEGVCDVVRVTYDAGEFEIESAQSKDLIIIKIKRSRFPSGTSDREKAEIVARKLLTLGDRIGFGQSGTFRAGSYGKQDAASKGRVDQHWPHWLDTMRWWCIGNEIDFITLKAPGGPTMAVISPSEDSNIHWF